MTLFGKTGIWHYRNNMLSDNELQRYHRHLILPGFGKEAQERLKSASVLVLGAGGLGAPVLQYLAAAGVGRIGIMDDDTVDVSNLQRQILFATADVGQPKAVVAGERIAALNPLVEVDIYQDRLSNENALAIIEKYDLVVDGTDNFPTRYRINDACVMLGKPFVYGSIFKFEGQVSVFNYRGGPTYRCLFPEPPSPGEVPNCAEIGVIGVLPGLIGTIQANEAIKILAEIGEPLTGKLLTLNALTMESRILEFEPDANARNITNLSDYAEFCGISDQTIREIDVNTLKNWLAAEDVVLLDVREPGEAEICRLGELLIPLGELPSRLDEVPKTDRMVVYCHHGGRSARAVEILQEAGFTNLYNLKGGIHAWASEVDLSMQVY